MNDEDDGKRVPADEFDKLAEERALDAKFRKANAEAERDRLARDSGVGATCVTPGVGPTMCCDGGCFSQAERWVGGKTYCTKHAAEARAVMERTEAVKKFAAEFPVPPLPVFPSDVQHRVDLSGAVARVHTQQVKALADYLLKEWAHEVGKAPEDGELPCAMAVRLLAAARVGGLRSVPGVDDAVRERCAPADQSGLKLIRYLRSNWVHELDESIDESAVEVAIRLLERARLDGMRGLNKPDAVARAGDVNDLDDPAVVAKAALGAVADQREVAVLRTILHATRGAFLDLSRRLIESADMIDVALREGKS